MEKLGQVDTSGPWIPMIKVFTLHNFDYLALDPKKRPRLVKEMYRVASDDSAATANSIISRMFEFCQDEDER